MERVIYNRNIFVKWLVFQFFDAPKEILKAWRNFLLFCLNYFSVKLLFRTFFSYWHKYHWAPPRGFEPALWLEAKAGNFISRILGAIVRTVLILLGLVAEVFFFLAGLAVFVGWLALPFILIFGLIFGIQLIF